LQAHTSDHGSMKANPFQHARDKPIMAKDLFDKAEIEISAKPVLRLELRNNRLDQSLNLSSNGLAFVKIVVVLVKLPGIVKCDVASS